MDGKGVENIPDDVYLLMFASVTHWDDEKIFSLDRKRFMTLAPMVEMVFRNQQYKP